MTSSIATLREAAGAGKPFRVDDLIFTASDAQKALELWEKLRDSSRSWFEGQPLMRMIFLGLADGIELPKSGKQIKLEKRALRRKLENEAEAADEEVTD